MVLVQSRESSCTLAVYCAPVSCHGQGRLARGQIRGSGSSLFLSPQLLDHIGVLISLARRRTRPLHLPDYKTHSAGHSQYCYPHLSVTLTPVRFLDISNINGCVTIRFIRFPKHHQSVSSVILHCHSSLLIFCRAAPLVRLASFCCSRS